MLAFRNASTRSKAGVNDRRGWVSTHPYAFAIGTSALFGAACGALGLVMSQLNVTRRELRALRSQLQAEQALRNGRERNRAA